MFEHASKQELAHSSIEIRKQDYTNRAVSISSERSVDAGSAVRIVGDGLLSGVSIDALVDTFKTEGNIRRMVSVCVDISSVIFDIGDWPPILTKQPNKSTGSLDAKRTPVLTCEQIHIVPTEERRPHTSFFMTPPL